MMKMTMCQSLIAKSFIEKNKYEILSKNIQPHWQPPWDHWICFTDRVGQVLGWGEKVWRGIVRGSKKLLFLSGHQATLNVWDIQRVFKEWPAHAHENQIPARRSRDFDQSERSRTGRSTVENIQSFSRPFNHSIYNLRVWSIFVQD